MKIQRMPEDIVPLLNDLVRRLTALETRPLGTVFVNETIIARDPGTGVETVIGDLKDYGEDRTGIKQWVNDTEPPAVPVMPIVTANLGVFSIVWTGFFEGDAPMAPDFSHLNVYGNNGTSTKLVGVVKTKDEVAIVTLDSEAMYDEVWSFWFTSVDQVGNESVPGPASANNQLTPLVESPDIQGAIDDIYEKIQQDFEKSMLAANGKNRIWHTPEPPVEDLNAPFIDGDMWFDTNNGNKIHVWKNLPEPGAWEATVLDSSALDDKVTDLIEAAKNQADVALETANGKNKSYHQPTAPSGTNHRVGDIWFDTDDSNKVYVWNGTKWDPSSAEWEIPQTVLDDVLYAKNKSDQAYSLANGKNKRVDSVNNPPANTTGYIAGDHWLKWSNLGTTGVLLQSWTVKNGAWVKDSMDPTYLPKVDIGQGTFGSLNGDRLEVNTVKAEKILVSATDNLIRDPNFNFPDTMWANQTSEMGVGPEKWSTDNTYAGGARSMVLTQKPQGTNQSSYAATPTDYFEVVPGDSYAAFSMVYSDNGTDNFMTQISQRVYFYDKNKTIISGGSGNVDVGKIVSSEWTTQSWNKVGGINVATAPVNAAYMKPRLTIYRTANTAPGTRKYYVGSISVMRAMDSTLITPEAIQTPHIKAGAITAESGIIASLDAGKIVTGSMHGKYIEAGTLLASKLAVRNNDNLLPNLTYEADDWNLSSGASIIDSSLSPEGKRLSFPPTALAQAIAYDVQVIPGEKYKVEANTYATTASQNLEICWFGKDGKGVGAGSGVLIKSTTANQKLSTEWVVPANVFSVRFSIRVPSTTPVNTATTGAYNFTVRKMTGTVLIENGAVTADQIKSGTITADSGVIASLDASKITVGEMDGKLIKANSILADRLVVGDFENYATVDPVLKTNNSHSSYKTETVGDYASAIGTGAYFMFRDPSNSVPFEINDKLRITFDAKSSNTSNQNVSVQLWTYLGLNGGGGNAGNFAGTPTTITPTEKRYEMFIEITSDISAAKSWLVGLSQAGSKNVLLRNITVRRMAKGELIVDGAITAGKLKTNAVESDKIKANAITADKIDVGAVTAQKIAAKAITADKLTIGTSENLVPDDSYETGSGGPIWNTVTGGAGSGSIFTEELTFGTYPRSQKLMFRTGTPSTAALYAASLKSDYYIPVVPGETYRVSSWVYLNADNVGNLSNVNQRAYLYASRTGSINNLSAGGAILPANVPTKTWFEVGGNVTIPAGMYFLAPRMTAYYPNNTANTPSGGNWYFSPPKVVRASGGELIVDGAIDGKTITGSTIQTDKADYIGLKMDNSGLRVYEEVLEGTPNSDTAVSTEFRPDGLTKIGIYGTVDGTKQYLAGLSADGDVTGQALNISGTTRLDGTVVMGGDPMENHGSGDYGPVIMGRDLLGATYTEFFNDNHGEGGSGWLTPMPHGLLSNSYHNGWGGASGNSWTIEGNPGKTQILTHIRDTVEIKNGRGYLITYTTPAFKSTDGKAGSPGAAVIKYTTGRTLGVDAGSPLHGSRYYISGSSDFDNPGRTVYAVGGQDLPVGDVTLGVEVYVYDGRKIESTGTGDARYWSINVLDVGSAFKGNTGNSSAISKKAPAAPSSPPVVDPPPAPKPPATKTYTTTFNYSWHKNFNSNGSAYVSSPMAGKASFGMSPYYTTGGTKRSHIGFSGNISGTLSGATVKKVEVYVYTEHWHNSAGGTLNVGYHNNGSAPTKSEVTSSNVVTWEAKSQKMKKPEGRWITLPNDSKWKAGTIKGIILRPPGNSSSASNYGYATANKTKLRITYTK